MNLTHGGKHKSVNFQKQTLYRELKNRVKFESYLSDIKNRKYRVTFTKFRLSDHDLMIEKGRHKCPKIPKIALRKSKMKATFPCNVFYIKIEIFIYLLFNNL